MLDLVFEIYNLQLVFACSRDFRNSGDLLLLGTESEESRPV